jgi:uncharacterized protein (DUF362 family)
MAPATVAIARGEDKFLLLEQVAEKSGFWDHLDRAFQDSGKSKDGFLIAIKPNLMILMSADVPEVATEPALVEHLIRLLQDRGFTNLKVVESQNTMGNWVRNRSVANVARVAGYTGDGYDIVDLTLEKVRHTYRVRGLPGWNNWVGRTWRDADYRIDFAKFKTQLDNYFTLCLKNEFGTLPLANKYWHYHTRIPYWACTLYTLANFPVDFGFVDAYRASDGTVGFAVQYDPKLLKMMLASRDIIALDLVGARLMGIDPWEAPLPRFVMQHLGEPDYTVVGDDTTLQDWENVPDDIQNIVDVAQAIYLLSNAGAMSGLLNLDTDEFPPRFAPMRWYYQWMNALLLFLNGKGLNRGDRRRVYAAVEHECTLRKQSGRIHREQSRR